MGGLTSLGTMFGTLGQVANMTSGVRKNYTDYRNVTAGYDLAKRKYEEKERDITEKATLNARERQAKREEDIRNRRNTLKRSVAEQQARFSGQGIDTTDGSGEAVLMGLYKDSSEKKTYEDRLNKVNDEKAAQENASQRRINLLSLQENYRRARDGLIKNLDDYV